MTKFIQLHLLTSYPPANLNRDDLGRPKTAKMGGVDRLRISSQSIKRAWRTSALFEEALTGHIGERTKRIGRRTFESLIEQGMNENLAEKNALAIANVFGALKSKKAAKQTGEISDEKKWEHLEIEQLVHISPKEKCNIDNLIAVLLAEQREATKEELKLLLSKEKRAVDIALFGRMLANEPGHNIEAAVQVAHPISVHPVTIEDDYFTAIDDLNNLSDARGAAHIGEAGFAAALFYSYICIDNELLEKHLTKDKELINKVLKSLTEAAAKVAPIGKQNSYGSRAYASYILAEKGSQQPRSLSVAFLKPVRGENYGNDAIAALKEHRTAIETVYGLCADYHYEVNTLLGEGKLNKLIDFICE